jgi:DNA-binding PadR family transcriptional regulator
MAKKLYTLNEQGQALLKTLVDPFSEFYIDAVIDLEEKMRRR